MYFWAITKSQSATMNGWLMIDLNLGDLNGATLSQNLKRFKMPAHGEVYSFCTRRESRFDSVLSSLKALVA